MAKETVYNNTLVSGAADETLTYTRYVKDESSGKSTKELLDEKVNKTDQLGTTQIADKAITTEKLENESVTTDKLNAASVTTDKVADANITTSKLADSSVETEKINNKAVTTDKLNDGAVVNSKLSPNAVTSEKIKDESVITEKLNDRAVTTEKVEEKAITNAKLGDQSVDGRVVRETSLETKHFANESVTTEKVARKSITKDKLADNAVDASQVVDGSIGNAKLSPDSVTTEKIKDGSVTNEKIADNTLVIGKFDPELRKTIQAATGLPDDLNQMIQDVDQSVKQLHEKDTDLQSQIDDKQQQITANDDDISLLQTRSTQMEEAIKGISASGGASQATAVSYENTESGLNSVTAQGAIDELANKKFNKENIAQEFGDSKDKVVSQFALPFREIESSEFIHAIVDAEDRFLIGIQLDGSIEWGKGIPAPIRVKLQEIINQCQQDKTDILEAINATKKELSASIAALQEGKVDKEEGKSLIEDEVKECFRVIENEEFLWAIVDSEDRVLFGIYRATGKPYYPLNEMYHVVQNLEYVLAWVDSDNKILLGIRRSDGQIIGEIHAVNALKQVISQFQLDVAALQEKVDTIDTNTQELLDVFSLQDNKEYIKAETDKDGKILSATYPDGSHYSRNLKSETIDKKVDKEEGKNLVDKDWANSKITLEDKDNYIATIDKDGKYLSYVTRNGSHYFHNVESETIDDLNDKIDDVSLNITNNDPSKYCDTGKGTFEEPYQSKDGTAGIYNAINNNSRGHRILFDDKNYLLTSSVILSEDPKMLEGKTMGYQNNPLGIKHGIAGSVLTLGNENTHIDLGNSHGIHLKKLGLYGINTKEFASREDYLFDPNAPEKNSAINITGYSDQNLLRDLCIVTRGAGIVAKNGNFDCSIIDHINFDGCNVGIWLDFERYSIHSRILNCILADMPSMAVYIKDWQWGFFEGNHLSGSGGIISDSIAQKVGCKAAIYINAHGSQIKNNMLREPGQCNTRIFGESEGGVAERECIGLAVCGDFNNIQGNGIRNAQKYALWVKGNKNTIIGNTIETSQQDGMNLEISESIVDGNLINIQNGGKSMIINGDGNIIQNNIGNTELIINGSNNLIGINSFSKITDNGANNKFLNI